MIRNDHLCTQLAVHSLTTKQLANFAALNLQLSSEPCIAEELAEAARNLCSSIQDAILTLRADAERLESIHDGKDGV